MYIVVERFPMTKQNYDICIDSLKDRFSKDDVKKHNIWTYITLINI